MNKDSQVKVVKTRVIYTFALFFLWVATLIFLGQIIKTNKAGANSEDDVTGSSDGEYSEIWQADEMISLFRMGNDTGQMSDNWWASAVGKRFCSSSNVKPSYSNMIGTSGRNWLPSGYCGYKTNLRYVGDAGVNIPGYQATQYSGLDSSSNLITKWSVNGHIH